jgi:hypothetical protein
VDRYQPDASRLPEFERHIAALIRLPADSQVAMCALAPELCREALGSGSVAGPHMRLWGRAPRGIGPIVQAWSHNKR